MSASAYPLTQSPPQARAETRETKKWPDADFTCLENVWDSFAGRLRATIGTDAGLAEYHLAFHGPAAVDYCKPDGEIYEVRRFLGEIRCTCNDYTYRRGPSGTLCKHGMHAVKTGLIRWRQEEGSSTLG